MLKTFEKAHPMCYGVTKIGRVYLAEDRPPLKVRETEEFIDGKTSIAFELEDILKVVKRELGIEEIPIFRFSLHPVDAKDLCCHLIHTLAKTGDLMAIHLEKEMLKKLE
jgi:hypothetical protein